jgi:DNA-binding transcriptional MerR regulator
MKDTKYTIQELCEQSGFSRRTVRYYVQIGLLDAPAGRGRGGFYFDSHLARLGRIKQLQDEGLNLAAIMAYLSVTTEQPPLPAGDNALASDPAGVQSFQHRREVWARYEIVPGIELAVRRECEESESKKVRELIRIARSLFAKE